MYSIETLRLAQNWLIAEVESERCIVKEPYGIDYIRSMSNEGLLWVSETYPRTFSDPKLLQAKKENCGIRLSHYVPLSDRLLLIAAIVSNYDAIYHYLKQGAKPVNYDRPLPENPNDIYLLQDHREFYQDFRGRIIKDENDNKHIIHGDIQNFAGSIYRDKLIGLMHGMGMTGESIDVIQAAFDKWKSKGIDGIPQGYAFTDIFLKIAMQPIDEVMQAEFPNVSYYRYVDDIQLSSDDKDTLRRAYDFLKNRLSENGLFLSDKKTIYASPDKKGIRHSFDSASFIEDFKQALLTARWSEKAELTDIDVIQHAYKSFVYPGGVDTKGAPKYLTSHILRQMRKNGINDFVQDLPRLMDKFPERTFKLLQYAAEIKNDGQLPLNGLAYYFFNDQNIRDTSMDVQRLEYLHVLKLNQFPISEFDRRMIASYLPDFIARNSFACGYRNDAKLTFEDKRTTPDLPKQIPA